MAHLYHLMCAKHVQCLSAPARDNPRDGVEIRESEAGRLFHALKKTTYMYRKNYTQAPAVEQGSLLFLMDLTRGG